MPIKGSFDYRNFDSLGDYWIKTKGKCLILSQVTLKMISNRASARYTCKTVNFSKGTSKKTLPLGQVCSILWMGGKLKEIGIKIG